MTRLFFIVILISLSTLFNPSQAQAQTCGTQIELDDFGCTNTGTNTDPNCSWVYQGTRSSRACSMQGPNCLTNSPYCTSNDNANNSCYQVPGSFGNWYCLTNTSSCSPAQCWINSDPTPTPPPGGYPPPPTPGCGCCDAQDWDPDTGVCSWPFRCCCGTGCMRGSDDSCLNHASCQNPPPPPSNAVLLGRVMVDHDLNSNPPGQYSVQSPVWLCNAFDFYTWENNSLVVSYTNPNRSGQVQVNSINNTQAGCNPDPHYASSGIPLDNNYSIRLNGLDTTQWYIHQVNFAGEASGRCSFNSGTQLVTCDMPVQGDYHAWFILRRVYAPSSDPHVSCNYEATNPIAPIGQYVFGSTNLAGVGNFQYSTYFMAMGNPPANPKDIAMAAYLGNPWRSGTTWQAWIVRRVYSLNAGTTVLSWPRNIFRVGRRCEVGTCTNMLCGDNTPCGRTFQQITDHIDSNQGIYSRDYRFNIDSNLKYSSGPQTNHTGSRSIRPANPPHSSNHSFSLQADGTYHATITWTPPSNSYTQHFQLATSTSALDNNCLPPVSCQSNTFVSRSVDSRTITDLSPGTTYYYRIRGTDQTIDYICTNPLSGSFTTLGNFNVNGNFMSVNDQSATFNSETCLPDNNYDLLTVSGTMSTNPTSLPGMTLDGPSDNTNYSINSIPITSSNVNININPPSVSGYSLLCPVIGSHSVSRFSTVRSHNEQVLRHFLYIQSFDPWWRVYDGNVHASVELNASMPESCSAASSCNEYIMNASANGEVGLVTADSFNLDNIDRDEFASANSWTALSGATAGFTGYDYFHELLNRNPNVNVPDASTDTVLDDLQVGDDGDLTILHYNVSDLTIEPQDANEANIESRKLIILVNGNVTIDTTEAITYDSGGFFMVVASDNITFAPSVGHAASAYAEATPNVSGIFIAGDQIIIGSGASQFVGRGVFAGRSGIQMLRDLGGLDDNTNPAHVFHYDPQLVLNTPDELMTKTTIWQEVAPFALP